MTQEPSSYLKLDLVSSVFLSLPNLLLHEWVSLPCLLQVFQQVKVCVEKYELPIGYYLEQNISTNIFVTMPIFQVSPCDFFPLCVGFQPSLNT